MSLTGVPEAVQKLLAELPVETKSIFDQLGINEDRLISMLDGLLTRQEGQVTADIKEVVNYLMVDIRTLLAEIVAGADDFELVVSLRKKTSTVNPNLTHLAKE